jgi:hypothetical protein
MYIKIRNDTLLTVDAGWYRVITKRVAGWKVGRSRPGGLEWRCCRVSLIDIAVNCGARRSWSAAGGGIAVASRDGVLAVGVCVCVLTAEDCQCSRRNNH